MNVIQNFLGEILTFSYAYLGQKMTYLVCFGILFHLIIMSIYRILPGIMPHLNNLILRIFNLVFTIILTVQAEITIYKRKKGVDPSILEHKIGDAFSSILIIIKTFQDKVLYYSRIINRKKAYNGFTIAILVICLAILYTEPSALGFYFKSYLKYEQWALKNIDVQETFLNYRWL